MCAYAEIPSQEEWFDYMGSYLVDCKAKPEINSCVEQILKENFGEKTKNLVESCSKESYLDKYDPEIGTNSLLRGEIMSQRELGVSVYPSIRINNEFFDVFLSFIDSWTTETDKQRSQWSHWDHLRKLHKSLWSLRRIPASKWPQVTLHLSRFSSLWPFAPLWISGALLLQSNEKGNAPASCRESPGRSHSARVPLSENERAEQWRKWPFFF